MFVYISIILGIIIIFFIFLYFYRIAKPLERIIQACEEFRKGNLDVKIDVQSKTKIGELARTFNKTLEDLKKSKEAMEESKAGLEVKIAARTRELERLAGGLDEKVKQKTKELQERIEDLERFQRLTVGRELKMLELKKEIKKLKNKNG